MRKRLEVHFAEKSLHSSNGPVVLPILNIMPYTLHFYIMIVYNVLNDICNDGYDIYVY